MKQAVAVKLNHYYFNFSNPGQKDAYTALKDCLAEKCEPWITDLSSYRSKNIPLPREVSRYWDAIKKFGTGLVHIEPEHLFADQWSTEEGWRIWRWAEVQWPNPNIVEGYYLTQTAELDALLQKTLKCGYCGAQHSTGQFCDKCLGSRYLKEDDLPLVRLVPVADTDKKRKPLSEGELEVLMPLYTQAQTVGTSERNKALVKQASKRLEKEYKEAIFKAEQEFLSGKWIIENCASLLRNHIYYSHTNTHCFGWTSGGLSTTQADFLLGIIADFPGKWEIKCADGRNLKSELTEGKGV